MNLLKDNSEFRIQNQLVRDLGPPIIIDHQIWEHPKCCKNLDSPHPLTPSPFIWDSGK
jgi:hypothetical protein